MFFNIQYKFKILFLFFVLIQIGNVANSRPLWSYQIEPVYTHHRCIPGYVGKLAIDSSLILPFTRNIETNIGSFEYRYRFQGCETIGGWIRTHEPAERQIVGDSLSDVELDQGWYDSAMGVKRDNTPLEWIYIPDIRRWVDSTKLNVLMSEWLNRNGIRYNVEVIPGEYFKFEGQLFYKDEEIVIHQDEIIKLKFKTDIGTYEWNGERIEESKWHIMEIHLVLEKSSGLTPLDEEVLDRGWIESEYPETTYQMPNGWIFWVDKQVWLDVKRINEIVSIFQTSAINWSEIN